MADLIILGAGGFAREASLLVEEINKARSDYEKWNLLGFIDEDRAKWGLILRGYPVLGGFDQLAALSAETRVISAVGDPVDKQGLVEKAAAQGRRFATLVHPEIALGDDVEVGEGVLINRQSVLTTSIRIGDHVSINPCCGVGHDAQIGAYSTLMWRVNISGAAVIEEGCTLGSGAVVLQGIKIGSNSIIGAGAVVTRDLPAGSTAAGVPAKVVRAAEKKEAQGNQEK